MFIMTRTTLRSAATLAVILTCGSLRAQSPATPPPTVGGVEAVGYTTIDANTGAYNH